MKKNAVITLIICSLFLFYKYMAQLFPSLIGSDLMRSHGYDAVMLAVMASSYYYSYTIMQIVSGLIVDCFSTKIPMVIAILIIASMMVLFTHTNNFYWICISRAMMGVGTAFATVIYMKCAAQYTTPKTFGVISSFLATATMLGAACGGAPVALLFHYTGWKEGLNMIAMMGFVMALMAFIFQRDNQVASNQRKVSVQLSRVREVIAKKDNWLLFLYSGLTFSPVAILGGLWGTPFLMAKYHLPEVNVSIFLSIMFIGHAIGSPLWAVLSARLNRKKELMHIANIISFLAIAGIIYGGFSYAFSLLLFFVFGFSVGCFMLSFDLCRKINALSIMGLSVSFMNSGEGLVSAILEPAIGYLLDISRVGGMLTLSSYKIALFILPCCFIVSSFVLIFAERSKVVVKDVLGKEPGLIPKPISAFE